MMRKRFGFLIAMLLIVFVGSQITRSQEATDTPDAGWPVEERCVGRPAKSPKGWSYEGTIFTADNGMYSEDGGGIHAIRQEVSTPYFVAMNGKDIVYGGALSPDGKWFAVPYGYSVDQHIDGFGDHAGSEYRVEAIHIYRTDYTQLAHTIDWRVSDQNVVIRKIMWLGNDRLIYWQDTDLPSEKKTVVVNPFTDERDTWQNVRENLTADQWKTFLEYENPYENGWLVEPRLSKLTQELAGQYGFNQAKMHWLADTGGFVVSIPRSVNSSEGFAFFNEQDGLKSIMTNKTVSQVKISADGRYAAFQTGGIDNQSREASEINIADLQTQTITQICSDTQYPAFEWSPFKDQLAIGKDGIISVLDLDSWHSYVVATKQGRLVGWREGW